MEDIGDNFISCAEEEDDDRVKKKQRKKKTKTKKSAQVVVAWPRNTPITWCRLRLQH